MNVNNTSVPAMSLKNDVLLGALAPCLSFPDCAVLRRVCSEWASVFTNEILDEILFDRSIFDEKKWRQIPGVNSVSPSPYKTDPELKKDYIKRLKSPCDIFNEPDKIKRHRFENPTNNRIRRIWETRRVILIPEMINDELVNINRINQILGFARANKTGTAFEYIIGKETDEYRTKVAGQTRYLEVTLDVIPGSRCTTHEKKENELLKPKGYRAPSPLEAVISNLVLNLGKEKEFFFGREGTWWTYTATEELFGRWRLVVGAASPLGPEVGHSPDDNSFVGVAAAVEVLLGHGS